MAGGKRTIPFGRIERAEELYLSSKTDREITKTLRAEFGVRPSQACKYLSLARKRCAAACAGVDPAERRAKIEALLLNAYATAEVGSTERGPQASAMVAAAAKLAEVHGVMAPQKIEHSGSIAADPKALHARAAAAVARVTGETDPAATRETDPARED